MNKRITKVWRIIIIIGLLVTIGVSVFVTFEINNISESYVEQKEKEVQEIRRIIDDELKTADFKELDRLIAESSIEISIKNVKNNKSIYYSIKDMNVNKNAITFEERFSQGDYEVWWLMYNILPQEVFDDNVRKISMAVILIIILIISLLGLLLFKFLQPLRELRANISKLSEFKLDEIQVRKTSDEYSTLNRNIAEFSHELDVFIKETGYKYTNLESQLQYQNEKLSYQNRLVASLTHNLKAPLVTVKYLMLDDIVNREEVNNKVDETITEINEISCLVFENEGISFDKEDFDLVELLFDINNSYKLSFKEKKLHINFDVDEKVIINDYKLQYKQLIHNAMSNIVSYAKVNADVEISCYIDNGKLVLSFYNDALQFTQEQLDNVFKLFYRISDSKEGLGTGLFTIKHITNTLEGEIVFSNIKDGVILEFKKNI